MPMVNGIDAIARIHEAWPEIAVIAFATTHDGEVVHAALAAGAMGYLLKDVTRESLICERAVGLAVEDFHSARSSPLTCSRSLGRPAVSTRRSVPASARSST